MARDARQHRRKPRWQETEPLRWEWPALSFSDFYVISLGSIMLSQVCLADVVELASVCWVDVVPVYPAALLPLLLLLLCSHLRFAARLKLQVITWCNFYEYCRGAEPRLKNPCFTRDAVAGLFAL